MNIMRRIIYWIYDISCIRYICNLIVPEIEKEGKRRPSKFVIWFIGVIEPPISLDNGLVVE
jgi:hypothetical protein